MKDGALRRGVRRTDMKNHFAARLAAFAQAVRLRRVGQRELLAHQQAQQACIDALG